MKKRTKILVMIFSCLVIVGAIFVMMFILPRPSTPLILFPSKEKQDPINPIKEPINPIIYVQNSTIGYNYYAIRIDGGNLLIENILNLTPGKLNEIPVLNSTIVENSTILNENRLSCINLFKNTKLIMRNINDVELSIYLFDNSELTVENCNLDTIRATGNSKVWIKNSNIDYVSDCIQIFFESYPPVSSTINILQNSFVLDVYLLKGSKLIVDDSTIGWLELGSLLPIGSLYGLPIISEPSAQAIITDSVIWELDLEGNSRANIYNSQITLYATVEELANLILNSSTVSNLDYGIICYNGTTNIIDGKPSGSNYINNTQLIGTSPGTMRLWNIAVNNSASIYFEGWPFLDQIFVYLYDSSSAQINNTDFSAGGFYIYALENSQLKINNCSYVYPTLCTNEQVLIDNCSITTTMLMVQNLGSPAGNVSITNSTILAVIVHGSALVTFENCSINLLMEGIVIYEGTINYNSTGLSGSGSYTNYTRFIACNITTRSLEYIEVNNSAKLNINDLMSISISLYLIDDASATLNNTDLAILSTADDSDGFLYNSTFINHPLVGYGIIMSFGSSNITIDRNSTMDDIYCMESSTIFMKNSTVIEDVIITESAIMTIRESTILESCYVMGSSPIDYSLKIYNSSVFEIEGRNWKS